MIGEIKCFVTTLVVSFFFFFFLDYLLYLYLFCFVLFLFLCERSTLFVCFLNIFTRSFIISKQLGPHLELFALCGVLNTVFVDRYIGVVLCVSFLIYNSHRKDSWSEFHIVYSLQWSIAPLG